MLPDCSEGSLHKLHWGGGGNDKKKGEGEPRTQSAIEAHGGISGVGWLLRRQGAASPTEMHIAGP